MRSGRKATLMPHKLVENLNIHGAPGEVWSVSVRSVCMVSEASGKVAMTATGNRRGGRIKGLFNVSCLSVSVSSFVCKICVLDQTCGVYADIIWQLSNEAL